MPEFWQFGTSLSPRITGVAVRRQACSEPSPVVAEKDGEQGEEDPRRRRCVVVVAVPASSGYSASAMSSHASPRCRASVSPRKVPQCHLSYGGSSSGDSTRDAERTGWWWRWWCLRAGAVEAGVAQVVSESYRGVIVEDVLVARDARVTTANGRWRGKEKEWERPDIGETGRKEGGTHTRRAMEMKEWAKPKSTTQLTEERKDGKRRKDDLGRGGDAAQAAFDADEEEGWRGEKGGEGGVGRREAGKGRQWMEGKGAGRDETRRDDAGREAEADA
ncbi:hypothetical protein C8J57DRAFT_1576376 [Mycena rebaudengoi]|nr:hypothetical protein C8J57DRAFT_1576376 [Mycena rebaudengoi]